MQKKYDVVIVGAGMVGLSLALKLKDGGLSVLLVEKGAFEDIFADTYDGRASAIAFGCFRMWKDLGLYDAFIDHACPMREIMVTDGYLPEALGAKKSPFYLRFSEEDIRERKEDEPLGYLIENQKIRQILYQACLERHIDIYPNASLDVVEDGDGALSLTINKEQTVFSSLLVSAEGRKSRLREQFNIKTSALNYGQSAIVLTVKCEKSHQNIAYEHFLPNGPFAILPMTQNRVCIVWTESHQKAEALMAMNEDEMMVHFNLRFGTFLGEVHLAGPRFIYPLGLMIAEQVTKNRLVLIGDSAHGIHPIAGQGLNLGLKDVAALSQTLVEAAKRGEDIGSSLVLERYASWRRFDTVSTSLIMDGFVRVFSNSHPALRMARGLGMSLINRLSPIKNILMQDAGAAFGNIPNSLKTN